MCADTCKDAQRDIIIAKSETNCKRFLLLCNIFLCPTGSMEIYV